MKTENISVNGKIIKCMEKEKYNGLMVKYTKDSIRMIKNMDLVHLVGLMEGNMLDSGKMENSMVGENTICQIKVKNLGNGSKARG